MTRPVLFVYKEIVGGDLRKLVAESNDSRSGGGARDLRLPSKSFRPVMHRIFTQDGVGRGGKSIRVAKISYIDETNKLATTELEYWPPTNSRPTEDRISRVHASPALGGQLPATNRGRVFVIFTLFSNDMARCDYAYENDLRLPNIWASEVSEQILGCAMSAAAHRGNRTVQGYYDFIKGKGYCHAD